MLYLFLRKSFKMNVTLLRRVRPALKSIISPLSTSVEFKEESFRTSENSPVHHNIQHSGLFYTLKTDKKKILFSSGGLPKTFEKQIKTFGETSLMVRTPTLEIIKCLENTDYSKPVNRYVLYGNEGCGKSLSLAHLIHFGIEKGFIVVHVPWVPNWLRRPREFNNSSTQEGFMDIPLDAAAWLIHFKTQNSQILNELNLTVSKDFVWSKRETTTAGSPLLAMIDHGINRVKYACDCVSAVLSELKDNSTQGRCKTLVAIDGFNSFFNPHTTILTDNKVVVPPNKVSLVPPFLDITKADWCNGAVVVTVDKIAMRSDEQASHLPRYLLGKEGFEHLDPFVPIQVDNYSEKEFASAINYYRDRRWLQVQSERADRELNFLSGRNPYRLMELCGPL